MADRLLDAISPYLRSHAANPVDWWQWGEDAFAEAVRRDVPVLVSIGYATCHWCHVMARESFSDPGLAARLNERFVAIKVDREEHPDVDASYLAAASAFTENLGWPLNVFVTPQGRAFYAGTYWPPVALPGQVSFVQVLDAVEEAWTTRRDEVEVSAAGLARAIAAAGTSGTGGDLPGDVAPAVAALARHEDTQYGGFGTAPKFPVAPVLLFLLEHPDGHELAERTLHAIASSPLRDPVEGGFFRYSTMRDWGEPHYERMLYDNAQLLDAYTRQWQHGGQGWAAATAAGVADFLLQIMQLPSGGFASAQDSESIVDGERVEGGYYALDAAARAAQPRPALDSKVLSGWNGLAIGALASAGFAFDRPELVAAASRAADHLLAAHLRADGTLVRASIDGRLSTARATLEDYGMLADGLLRLALAGGEVRYAEAGRALLDAVLTVEGEAPFRVAEGADPVLVAQGVALSTDPSEGAYPSGMSACAAAARRLYLLSGDRRYLDAARTALASVAAQALTNPIGFGATLRELTRLARAVVQLIVVTPNQTVGLADGAATGDEDATADAGVVAAARRHRADVVCVLTERQTAVFAAAGFELFQGRTAKPGAAASSGGTVIPAEPLAYLCRDFVCRLPTADPAELRV